MKKPKFKSIIVCFLMLLCVTPMYCWNFFVDYRHANFSTDDMPLYIRDVPIHHDDTYVNPNHAGPVARKSYKINSDTVVGIEWIRKFEKDDLSLRFRIVFIPNNCGDKSERNYTNSVGTDYSGVGAALTYCRMYNTGLINVVRASPEIAIEKLLTEKLSMMLSLGYNCVKVDNGWNRWEKHEVNKTYKLADCFPTSLIVKYSFKILEFNGGVTLLNPIPTEHGNNDILNYNYVEYQIGTSFNLSNLFKFMD